MMIRSIQRGTRVLTIGGCLLLIAGAVSAGKWIQDGRPNDPKAPNPCDCAPITGTVGKIGEWQRTGAGQSTSQFHEGFYGGRWDGSRWLLCPIGAGNQDDILEHKYKQVSGTSNRYLRVEATSHPKYAGSATEMTPTVPPQWWWTCNCIVNQHSPTASYQTSAGADPITIPLEEVNNVAGKADGGKFGPNDPVTQPNVTPPPPPRTYPCPGGVAHHPPNKPKPPDPLAGPPVTNPGETTYPKSNPGYDQGDPHRDPLGGGDYWARSLEKIPAAAKYISIKMGLDANASISSDNATVAGWEVSLLIRFETEMSSAKPPKP